MTTDVRQTRTVLSYAKRDDEAACKDCEWTWKYADHAPGTTAARAINQHMRDKSHDIVLKRVEFVEYVFA